jgi:ATP citrate (pro-S)-lyase
MSSKAIREYDAKLLLAYWLQRVPSPNPNFNIPPSSTLQFPAPRVAQVQWDSLTNLVTPDTLLPSWVSTTKLVAKPDQLIKRRGKAGLLALNKNWADAKNWILERAGKPQKVSIFSFLFLFLLSKPNFQVESVTGTLNCFIVEPFVPHPSEAEYYICITSSRHADTLLFTTGGGVDVGDVDAKALKLDIPVLGPFPTRIELQNILLHDVPKHKKEVLTDFQIGTLNGLFVLGRSIGFIGHHLDQKRLRAPLYRHPADDIFINIADLSQPRVLGKVQ